MKHSEEQWLKWMDTIADQDYVVVEEFFDLPLLSSIHDFFDQKIDEDDFRKAAIGPGDASLKIPEIRGDYIYWLDHQKDPELQSFFDFGEEMIYAFNRYCFLSLKASEFHLAQYPVGSFYKNHIDQFDGRNNRMITFLLYLNKDWQKGYGGELRIHLGDQNIDIEPINNRCIIFASDKILHEVLPTNIVRRSLTGWLLHKPSILGSILD